MENEDRLKAALADRYRIEREIGRGGMATVYLARDLRHERQVAVKVLNPELAQGLGADRFLREIRTAANLTHPHILPVHDSGEADGFLYYVMPYVKGESLRSRLEREGQLPVDEAVLIAREVAGALDYAHREGLVHRDVKPANIMLEEGHAVLADFGVAHALAEADEERITRTGTSLGTPTYMSPEQGTGEHELDGRSDVYALGCVLYEMLAGEAPYTGPTAQAIIAKRLSEPVPWVRTLRETVPQAVEGAIRKALAKAPVDRYRTAGAFGEALGAGLLEADGPRPIARTRSWMGKGVAIALAVVLVVAGVWWVSTRLRSPAGPIERLAVLPFRDYSGDTSRAWVDGVHSEIISKLHGIGALTVLPQQSVLRFQGSELSPTEIAEALDVDALLTGDFSREADRVVIHLDLITIRPHEESAWNRRFESSIEHILAFYGDIAGAVADELVAPLTPEEETRLADMPDVDPEAYDLYIVGRHIHDQRDVAHFEEAIELLQQSIRLDSSFAPAHSTLADVYQSQAAYFLAPTAPASALAKREALAALDLNPDLADAYVTLGWARMSADYDWEGAEKDFRQAIDLDGGNPTAHQNYGQFLAYMGRVEEGLEQLRRAVELDSIAPAPSIFLGYGLTLAGEYGEAIEQYRKILESDPDHELAHFFYSVPLLEAGLYEEAEAEIMEAIDKGGRQPMFLGMLALVYGRMGHGESSRAIIQELMGRRDQGLYVASDIIAWAYVGLGEYDHALDWLERAYAEREQGMVHLKMAPWLDPLRANPRFQALLKKMNFPDS